MILDPNTALYLFFGGMALCGAVVVMLDWLGQRQQRRAQRPQK